MKEVNDCYSIIEATDEPLSSDVAIVKGNTNTWVFDVGANKKNVEELNKIDNKVIVISHFHQDHITNLKDINYKQLYVSSHTYKYTHTGIIVDKDTVVDNMTIYVLPNSHAKGSLALKVDDYLFVGDALGPMIKKDELLYNVSLLKEEIDKLESIDVKYVVSSHRMQEVQTKQEVLEKLYKIYASREKSNPYIVMV